MSARVACPGAQIGEVTEMCESTVYLSEGSDEEKIFEGVDSFECLGDQIRFVNLFGEEKKVRARIRTLQLIDHRIILEPLAP